MRARKRPSLALPRPVCRRMCARTKAERELPGEQFVIGKPCPCRVFRQDVVRLGGPVQMS